MSCIHSYRAELGTRYNCCVLRQSGTVLRPNNCPPSHYCYILCLYSIFNSDGQPFFVLKHVIKVSACFRLHGHLSPRYKNCRMPSSGNRTEKCVFYFFTGINFSLGMTAWRLFVYYRDDSGEIIWLL